MKRRSGILAHISSLPGDYSIGSIGEAARRFVDVIAEAGFSLWQILPLSMTDECASPYKSPASFGANPYLIDLPELYEEGLITKSELVEAAQVTEGRAELSRIAEERITLLRRAAERVIDRSEIIAYIDERPELSRAAYFLALRATNGGKPWQEWESFVCEIDELFFWQFVQFKFYTQWYRLKAYANSRGVSIIGDLPIYVAPDSADVWAEPEQFLLDERGYPSELAGVPPDYFSKDGQLWGNPIYDWEKMKRDGYAWWRRRLSHALSMYDGVRIDHFRAIEAYWSVAQGAESAKEGRWCDGPRESFVDMIREVADGRLIIAEDLGDITDEVRALVDYSGFPGMRVLQFGFLGESDSLHLPHNYPRHTVAYSGTHDNNTLVGYFSELDGSARARLADYVGAPTDLPTDEQERAVARAAVRTLFSSAADTVIIPVQDVFGLGSADRMNVPGVAGGNWGYRLTRHLLESFPIAEYRRMNEIFCRG